MKIVVTRAFMHGGKLQPVGSSLELADRACIELLAMNKAIRAPSEPAAPPPGPLTTETAAAAVKGKVAKESPHAGE